MANETIQLVPHTVKCSFQAHWSNAEKITNTAHFWYSSGAAITPTDLATLVNDLQVEWQTGLVTHFVDNYIYDGVAYLDMDTVEGATGFIPKDPTAPGVGASTGAALPPNVAILVKKTISSSGRKRKPGRFYLPGGAEGEVDENGLLTSTILPILQGYMDALLAAWNSVVVPGGDTVVTVQPHFSSIDDPGDAGGIWQAADTSVVSGFVVDPKVSTQRRRLR